MTHYKIVPADQWDRLTGWHAHRKHLADPAADVFFLVVLTVTLLVLIAILVFAGYMHLSVGF